MAAWVWSLGSSAEWHLVLAKAFYHITFGLMPWFPEKAVVLGSTLPQPRFIPVGSIGDSMAGDGIQYLLVEVPAEGGVPFAPESDHRLEGLQRLDRSPGRTG